MAGDAGLGVVHLGTKNKGGVTHVKGLVAQTVNHLPTIHRDPGSIPGLGRSPGEGRDNPLQYSCLENPIDRGDWWSTVHRVTKSDTTERLLHFTDVKEMELSLMSGVCNT